MSQAQTDPVPAPVVVEGMVSIKLLIPRSWKVWLDEAARVRGLSRAALVRQCIRGLMIERHGNGA